MSYDSNLVRYLSSLVSGQEIAIYEDQIFKSLTFIKYARLYPYTPIRRGKLIHPPTEFFVIVDQNNYDSLVSITYPSPDPGYELKFTTFASLDIKIDTQLNQKLFLVKCVNLSPRFGN